MKPFSGIISEGEIVDLVAYVSEAFVDCGDIWPRYHTVANGWPDHRAKYQTAYPYVLGQRPVAAVGAASDAGGQGLRLYRETCSVCHDPAAASAAAALVLVAGEGASSSGAAQSEEEEEEHEYDHDAEYATEHDIAPQIAGLTAAEARGEALYQTNCALCHAADGTGRNWIGSFLDPQPRDFTEAGMLAGSDDETLVRVTLDGLKNTSMPAFRSALSRADAADIVAYLRRAFQSP